ncbi:MAG: modification methylase [Gammaproteobacteria bacterium]|nr:modification methylase [Gammaproteobacteria bacterium]
MRKTNDLRKAKEVQFDEWYTQRSDIDYELKHYRPHFKNQIVYCNCDDPKISNFYRYFSDNFHRLALKHLITTCYRNNEPDIFSKHKLENGVRLDCPRGELIDGAYQPSVPVITELNGDGDFRSSECIEILRSTDIVVTNPPFSKFQEYITQLITNKKKFLILGGAASVATKNIFDFIQQGKVWLGTKSISGGMYFDIPKWKQEEVLESGKKNGYTIKNGVVKKISPVVWYTNLDHHRRHEEMFLFRKYSKQKFPKYDNYDAIHVENVNDIPKDYPGEMGVPTTFVDKWNPDQFELVGTDRQVTKAKSGKQSRFYLDGKELFAKFVIRNKRIEKRECHAAESDH